MTGPISQNIEISLPAMDYQLGDAVVYRTFHYDHLHVIDALFEDGSLGVTGFKKSESWLSGFTSADAIRPATKAEIRARKRLL